MMLISFRKLTYEAHFIPFNSEDDCRVTSSGWFGSIAQRQGESLHFLCTANNFIVCKSELERAGVGSEAECVCVCDAISPWR